jgi:uncharacterized membrane protein
MNIESINFSHLGNLILGITGAVSVFAVSMGNYYVAGVVAAVGVMSKAICSAVDEYKFQQEFKV